MQDKNFFYEDDKTKKELEEKRKLLISKIENASLNDIKKLLIVVDDIIKSETRSVKSEK